MSKSDTILENVKVWGGLPEERDAPTHWPFTSCSGCSIFNVSQLTAAHTGSLVRNATHATTPAWQAHALVVLLLSSGLPNTPRGGGGRRWPLQCLWLSVALLEWLEWYLYFTGRLRARWSRLASSAAPGRCPTWPRSPEPMKLSLRAEGSAGGSRLPLRLFTNGTDTGATPLQGPLLTSLAELWFSLADLYW